jgi:glycosyltransferase involved in cell wall biosynthesis
MPLVQKSIKTRVYCHNLRYERSFRRIAEQDRALLAEARLKNEPLYASEKEPLISVTIPTYNRGQLLVERTLPSVLSQTYENFEVVIIGDHCTDNTGELIAKIKDPRVRFYNLPERYRYLEDSIKRWKIAGIVAINVAHEMARGSWIAHLDDDDVFTPDHLEKSLACAQTGNYEFVSGRAKIEVRSGEWIERGSPLFRKELLTGRALHSTILYRSYVNDVIGYESRCLDYGMNGDAFRMRRMFNAGVRAGFVDQVTMLQPLRPDQGSRQAFHPTD